MSACLRCGSILVAGARYCAACGTPIAAAATVPAPAAYPPPPAPWPAPTAPPTRGGMPLRLGLLAIVAIVVTGAAIWQVSNSGSPDTSTLPPPTTPLSGEVVVGPPQEIVSGTSEPGQSTTLQVPAGEPLAGMAVSVPGDAYDAQTAFTVSVQKLQVNGYGGRITALTDLVAIENGGAYSAAPMTVTIPVVLPAGAFAMGLYLGDDGSLEPMPLVDETPSSVSVLTRHFSRFFLAVIAEAALPDNIGTGFRAHEDDIQTPNYGSYVAPGGYCAGQALAEMWYFEERKAAGAPQLWGLTDNTGKGATPGFWPDDSYAYRLSSSIQDAAGSASLEAKIEASFGEAKLDQLQWDAFRYAMLITGQPQFVVLKVAGEPGGHAVVAYAASRSGLWVADPNFPGKLRDIEWDWNARGFKAYDSGANATSSTKHYDRIAFYGKTALIDWDRIGTFWAQVDDGTIGAGVFPAYDLVALAQDDQGNDIWVPLVNGYQTGTKQLTIAIRDPVDDVRISVYRGTSSTLAAPADQVVTIDLTDGENPLGIYEQGSKTAWKTWQAVDFVRLTVILGAVPTPGPTPTAAATPVATPTAWFDCSAGRPEGVTGATWDLLCTGITATPPPPPVTLRP
jgi:hypothetical protein